MQTTANPADIVASSGTNITGVLFGNFQLVSISGLKFNDLNGNGVRNPGEPGLAGITIFLDANNNGVLDPGEVSTTSDVNGNYTFANLGPGTYHVREVVPVGSMQTTVNPAAIVVSSGTNITGVLFGNFKLISISGIKFNDLNGNGVRNAGEPGLAGVTVFLDTNNNGVLDPGERHTTTGVNGTYSFANLGPGTYRVREVAQSGWIQMTNKPSNIVARSGTNVTNVLFGNTLVTSMMSPSKLLLTGGNLFNLQNGNVAMQAAFVANLYETLLGRAPDLAGLIRYLDLLMAGFSQQQVTAIFRANFGR